MAYTHTKTGDQSRYPSGKRCEVSHKKDSALIASLLLSAISSSAMTILTSWKFPQHVQNNKINEYFIKFVFVNYQIIFLMIFKPRSATNFLSTTYSDFIGKKWGNELERLDHLNNK